MDCSREREGDSRESNPVERERVILEREMDCSREKTESKRECEIQ